MPVAIAAQSTVPGGANTGSFQDISLFAPANTDDLLFICMVASGTNEIDRIEVNGNPDPHQQVFAYIAGQSWSARLVRCTGAEQFIRVIPTNPNVRYASFVYRLTDEAHLKPYPNYVNTYPGLPTPMTTIPWVADDNGLAIVTWVSTEVAFPNLPINPPGWVSYTGGIGGPDPNWQSLARPTTPGAQASETFTNPTENWLVVLMVFYDLALRLPPAVGYLNIGLSTESGGPPERTEVVLVAPDAEGPMPPEPNEIEVPLPPWIPSTGPYRHGS